MTETQNSSHTDVALKYRRNGLSVFPTGQHKRPIIEDLNSRFLQIADEETIRMDFANPSACVAVAMGRVSGNAESFDFDFKAELEGMNDEQLETIDNWLENSLNEQTLTDTDNLHFSPFGDFSPRNSGIPEDLPHTRS